MMSQSDAAAILGVGVDASRAVVQRAFREIARDVHPDSGNGDEAVKLQQAKEARDTLLAALALRNRRMVNGPRPWPPASDSWPPTTETANGADAPTTLNGFARPVQFSSAATPNSDEDAGDARSERKEFADRLSEASDRGSNWVVALTLVGILVVFLVVGAILIVGALFGSSPESKPATNVSGCVAITDTGLTEVGCDRSDAQRVVSRTESIVTCPPGQNTLIVDQTTWCLELVSS